MTIDIRGVDKALVFKALYDNAKPLGMGWVHYVPGPISLEEAREILATDTYFDYVKGRVMKVHMDRDFIDPWLYDRDNGQGAAEMAILEVLTRP